MPAHQPVPPPPPPPVSAPPAAARTVGECESVSSVRGPARPVPPAAPPPPALFEARREALIA
eukprot:14852828-Alexandrium_andersonii.AAC.1